MDECARCGDPLPVIHRRDRCYCSSRCRVVAHRAARAAARAPEVVYAARSRSAWSEVDAAELELDSIEDAGIPSRRIYDAMLAQAYRARQRAAHWDRYVWKFGNDQAE
jgi:hypothetical protein